MRPFHLASTWIGQTVILGLILSARHVRSADPRAIDVERPSTAQKTGKNEEQDQKALERFEDEKHALAVENAARRTREAEPFRAKLLHEQGYAVPADRNLIRVVAQRSSEREEFYGIIGGFRRDSRGKFDERPGQLVFASDGTSLDLRATGTIDFGFLVQVAFGLSAPFVDAPDRVLKSQFVGDWVIRESARHKPALLMHDFERILNDEFQLNVKVSYRDVLRPVYVASGDYAHVPSRGERKPRTVRYYGQHYVVDHVDLYARDRTADNGSLQPMELAVFLNAVGSRIRMPIVDEIRTPPTNLIGLREHHSTLWRGERDFNSDPDLVLPRINEQTAIEFRKDERVIKMLVIEDANNSR